MAKKLLHSVLVKVLGEFIDLNEENLNLAVWNGQIVLNNLNLKTDQILKNFNLNVFHGTIQRLEVTIPWATLLINPVKIVISGVLLDVGPLDIAKLGKVEALKRYMAEKLQKLKMVDQYLELSLNLKTDGETETNASSDNNTNSESYIQQWSAKVIDNIEIKVSDLHVRYEDSLSIPGRVFACGITLESFGISTCDNNWNIAGSTRGTDPTGQFKVNKLAYLKSLGVYWQVDASSLAHMPLKEWERLMMTYIVRESSTPSWGNVGTPEAVLQPREYILSPYNNTLTVKLTQNKKPTATSPKFDIRAESSNLQIQLDSVQYVELFSVMDRLGALGKMYKPKTYRPYDRPIDRESCVAWWKYACKLAVRVRKYIDLVKLSLRLAAGREDPHTYLPGYAAKEMRYLEERLPFEPLRVGRQRAMLEIFEEHKQQQRLLTRGQTPSKSTSGWFGSWSSSSNNPETFISPLGSKSISGSMRTDEDISIESIMAALNEPEQSAKPKQSKEKEIVVSMIRLSLESSSTALISHAYQPLIQCNSALSLSFTKTSSGMSFKCNLNDLYVLDRFTVNPPVPYIVAVKSDLSYVQRSLQLDKKNNKQSAAATTSTFSFLFERLNGKSKVVIAALPIELCLNKECIQMILNTFARPINKYAIKETTKAPKRAPAKPQGALSTAQLGIENLRNVSQHNDDIELILQASAPKIIIPESSEDSGYVLVDCGNLELRGFLGTTGMSMSLGLHQLNVGMPLTVRDMYKHGEKALYLIKPFDILMHVQNIDQSEAGLTVNVEVKPEIRGEVDSVKLARLLTALGQVSGIFAKLPHLSPATPDIDPKSLNGASIGTAVISANSPDIHLKAPVYLRTVKSFVRAPPRTTATIENVVDAAVDAAQVSVSTASSVTPGSLQTPLKVAELPHLSMGNDSPGSDDGFHTPLKDRASLASTAPSSVGKSGGSAGPSGKTINDGAHFATPSKTTSTTFNTKAPSGAKNTLSATRSPEQPAQDPTVVNMRIDVLLPVVALDLTYDVQRGYHLVLEVKTLRTVVSTRPYDRSIIFEMSEMSMRDSFRAEAQEHLIWTPPDFGKLVHFSYINMSSKLSPYYNNHATEIVMKFANLCLNVDVNTIKHLRPFFEVLLSRRDSPSPDNNTNNASSAPSASSSPRPASDTSKSPVTSQNDLLALNDPSTPPTGSCVTATLERISLDFLRAPLVEKKNALLETAFSVQISGMRCDMDMQGLMVAEVRLRSFEILDMRHISSDYVFKKIFCPAFENLDFANRPSATDLSALNVNATSQAGALYNTVVARSEESESPASLSLSSVGYALSLKDLDVSAPQTPRSTAQSSPLPTANTNTNNNTDYKKEKNLLFVVFRQQSSTHNHFDIEITDITAFIAIDTILDLTSVVLANLFAFFGLLAAPAPPVSDSIKSAGSLKDSPSKAIGTLTEKGAATVTRTASTRKISPQSPSSSSDEAEPSGAAQSSFREVPEVVGNILSAMLHITNPRLIFLEDPSTVESQAIVGTCGVVLNFTRETKNRIVTVSMFESLHVTLSKYEVYVLKNMTKWYPQPILEPMELELHLKRRVVDGVTKMMSLHVEVDNIDTQVSFNDIILAQSILSRRVLSEAPPAEPAPAPAPAADATNSTTTASTAKAGPSNEAQDLSPPVPEDPLDDSFAQPAAPQHSIMNFQFGMGTLSMVIINDFNGQSIPIIKTTVNNTFFGMESAGPRVSGDGSMEAKVDFFNSRLSTWEPILDIWQPSARIYSMNDTKIFEIKSEYTMQLTVSGIILETLLRSYSLFFHDLDVLAERTALSGVSVCNLLGDVVEVQLRDSASNQVLLNLSGGQTGLVTSLHDQSGKIWSKSINLPSSVDLHFKGMFKAQRMPLFHLPLNINKPKAYNLQPAPHCADYKHDEEVSPVGSPQPDNSVWVTKPSVKSKVYVIEPIVEEVYENARYDPLAGTWRKPYFMGDPYEWTDGSGTIRKDIGSIELVSDRWEWQGKWEIDLDGQIGVEIDAQGWEYANSFSFFTMVSVRRASQAMDGCRRRRWTRTRIPRASSTSLLERPLTLFWDVQVQKNGARRIDLRSALQFSNQIAFPVIISLQQSAWDREVELGPIAPGAVYSVPLLYSYATAVRFRPDFPLYEWSDYYPCSTHAYDFTRTKSATCAAAEAEINPIWFRVHTTQTSKSVMVNVVPYISVTNKLLCDMRIRCMDKNRVTEEGEIESGRDMKLSFISVANQPMLSIKVGNFDWSDAIMLCVNKDSASLFELFLPGRKRATKLYLSMNSKLCPMRGVSIEIFSKVAIIDRTSLHLFVASKLRPGVNLVRSTCATLRDFSKSHQQPLQQADQQEQDQLDVAEAAESLTQLDFTDNNRVRTTTDDISYAGPSSLQLKMPSNASRTVSVSSTDSRNNSHQHLAHLLAAPLQDGCESPGMSKPLKNSFSYSSNYPESATVRVDNTPYTKDITANLQTGTRSKLASGETVLPDLRDEKAGGEMPPLGETVLVRDIEVSSRNKYQLMRSAPGKRVYSDHKMRWCYLPPCLLDQLQLRTPFEDRLQRSNRLVQFTTSSPCMLLVLVDINAPLKWLLAEGFTLVREIATARSVNRGSLEELHFAIYGKICTAEQRVVLKASWNKATLTMYSLFFLPIDPDGGGVGSTGQPTANTGGVSKAVSGGMPLAAADPEVDEAAAMRADSLDSLFRQLNFKNSYNRELATRSWTEGSHNLSLMYTYDNIITVGLCKGKVWSKEINIDTRKNAVSKGSFEVDNVESNISYQLSYGLHALPGLYSETQLIYFMPKYCILNCTEEVLLVSQRGSEKYLQYLPYRPEGWHKLELASGTEVQLRTASTLWSLGAIDINDIGSSVVYIPYRDGAVLDPNKPGNIANAKEAPTQGIVLHVEVKLADPTDHCSIIVIIWQETIESRAAMSIRNTSDVAITIRQAEIEMDHEIQDQEHLFELCVPPGCSVPFGWADPESGTDVLVTVGEGLKGQNKRIASINMLKPDQLLRLPYNFGRYNAKGEVVISVSTNNSGHVLEVSNLSKSSFLTNDTDGEENAATEVAADIDLRQRNQAFPTYGFNFLLSSFGVSLVVEKPQRREFLSLYIDWFEVLLRMKGSMRSLEFVIMDLQVDNYSETVIYPVLLRSRKKEIRRSVTLGGEGEDAANINTRNRQESNLLTQAHPGTDSTRSASTSSEDYQRKPDDPFVKLTIIQEVPADGSQAVFKYVAVRVLSLAVEVDSATVQLLFTDLLDDLKILTHSQALALSMPDRWLNEFNMKQLYPQQQLRMVKVYRSKIQAQQSKMYFKNLIIHPIKITFTFAQTTFPRRQHKETLQSTVLNVLMSLVGVEKLRLHLRSFEVEDAMESFGTLTDMISSKTIQDVRSQLTQIAGSLTMLGSPIGFARKVGSGVKAFFYEPYQGAVQSGDFVAGLGRGTSTLFTGVVSGAMDSAVAIVGTASKGMSHLSGDADYVRKRAIKRQQGKVNGGGILEGIREGGESVLSGISSGVTGLVTKPIEEASKSGFGGFFKGLGLGLIGVAVKPVIGLSDGLTSVAQGISNQVDSTVKTSHVRPPRALEPSAIDPAILVVVPLNLEAAFAQEFIAKRAKQNHYEDSFLRFIPLETKGEAIILSHIYVFWRRKSSLWGRVWANISHCVYMNDSVGIMLYSGGKNGGASLVTIPCKSAQTAKRVYAALAQNTSRMGNPSNIIPIDIVMKSGALSPSASREQDLHTLLRDGRRTTQNFSDAQRQVVDESQLGALDGYRFGTANGTVLTQITGSEDDVLKRAAHHLEKEIGSWQRVDQHIWRLLWEWGCIHSNLSACRCSVTLLVNRSDSPIQITRVQLVIGRNVLIMGSSQTGYEAESRSLMPEGMMIVFICAFPESPLDIGHLKANINTAAFSAVVASTQRESFCEAKGGFTIGFLEKTVSDWWSKYVIVIS